MSKSLKEQWIKDRTEQLRTGPSTALVHLAEDNTIPIDDLMSRKDLAKQIAEAEWASRKGPLNFEQMDRNFATASGLRDAVERAGLYVGESPDLPPKWRHGKGLDPDFSPWGLDPETCGESGPTESINAEEEPPRVTLQRNIMNRGLREPATSSGWFIYEVLLPEFLEQFLAKNADYGDQHRTGLGVRAEYVGIHRKVEKLKTALWDGQTMNGEGPREMLFDLIGQCFIVLDLMAQEQA